MATEIYVRIENVDGEVLTEDSCTRESIGAYEKVDHDEEAYVLSFDHEVTLPTDDRSGQVTGAPRHKYLTIKKFVDRCSPLLAGHLVNPSDLEVEFNFYRQGEGGQEHFYTITLEGAKIVNVQTVSPNVLDPNNDREVLSEIVTFTYGKIDWEHEICSTSASDDSTGR